MFLKFFTQNSPFNFFIQYGHHEEDLYMHMHEDFCELTIVLSGTAVHIVNNERFVVNKGDVFIINNNIAHGYENPQDFKICNIMFRFEEMFTLNNDIRKLAGFHALFVLEPYLNSDYQFESRLHLSINDFEGISNSIAEMIWEYDSKCEGWITILSAEFMKLAVVLSRLYNFPQMQIRKEAYLVDKIGQEKIISVQSTDTILNLAVAISYMEQHFTEPITLVELASMINVSVRHFSRLFEKAYHISPGGYIIQLRIQSARILLQNNELTISEIAYQVGYSDSNYFARHFKKIMGLTPGEYRKSVATRQQKNY